MVLRVVCSQSPPDFEKHRKKAAQPDRQNPTSRPGRKHVPGRKGLLPRTRLRLVPARQGAAPAASKLPLSTTNSRPPSPRGRATPHRSPSEQSPSPKHGVCPLSGGGSGSDSAARTRTGDKPPRFGPSGAESTSPSPDFLPSFQV